VFPFCALPSQTGLTVAFSLVLTWIIGLVLLLGFLGYRHVTRLPEAKLAVRVTRVMVTLSAGVFCLPILSILFRSATCDSVVSSWTENKQCWGGLHAGIASVAIPALVLHTVASCVFTMVFVDRNLLSTNARARTTGRLDAYILIGKLVLSFLFNGIPDHVSGGFLIFALVSFSVLWVVGFMKMMPMIRPWQNSVWIGVGSVYCWVSGCLVLAKLIDRDVGLTVVFGGPLAGLAALFVMQVRTSTLTECDPSEIRTVYHADLWARTRVREAVTAAMALENKDEAVSSISQFIESLSQTRANVASKRRKSSGLRDRLVKNGVVTLARDTKCYEESSSDSRNQTAEVLREAVEQADQAYRQVLRHEPGSAMLHLFTAQFYRLVHKYHFSEMTMLHKAHAMSSAIDVRFFVFKRTRQLQESSNDGEEAQNNRHDLVASRASSADRIAFERLSADAEACRLAYYKTESELLSAMNEALPDMRNIERIGHDLVRARRTVVAAHEAMMAVNNNSVKGYRSYAVFLEEIMHDSEQAQEFLTKAARIEESYLQQKAWSMNDMAFGTRVDGLSQMDEHDAVLVLSGATNRLGEILSANTKSSTMLGLQRVVLMGRPLSSLFPSPVSSWIASEVESFAWSGECSVIDTPMLMPVLTGNGSLIPAVMHLKEHPPEVEGGAPQLMLVLKPVTSNSEIALFDGKVGVHLLFA
jgi:hypothetical protein